MPCGDFSEHLEFHLDANGRLSYFSLAKQSCGAPVGGTLLEPYVIGQYPEQLVTQALPELVADFATQRATTRFLLEKQFNALKAAFRAYTGEASAGKNDLFAMLCVDYDATSIVVEGLLRVDLAAQAVTPCKGCASSSCTTP